MVRSQNFDILLENRLVLQISFKKTFPLVHYNQKLQDEVGVFPFIYYMQSQFYWHIGRFLLNNMDNVIDTPLSIAYLYVLFK